MHKDTQLIVAHLLGGTSGLNLQGLKDESEIRQLVARAIAIALEIERQTAALDETQKPEASIQRLF
jgi:hypothetical protein